MDAFVAYRSRQLQAPRALITDLSSTFSLPDLLRGEVAEDDQELEDLKIVCLTKCTGCVVMASLCSPHWSLSLMNGLSLAIDTCTKSTIDAAKGNQCTAGTC